MLWALLSTNKGSSKICRLCLIPKKALRKEKKMLKKMIFSYLVLLLKNAKENQI